MEFLIAVIDVLQEDSEERGRDPLTETFEKAVGRADEETDDEIAVAKTQCTEQLTTLLSSRRKRTTGSKPRKGPK